MCGEQFNVKRTQFHKEKTCNDTSRTQIPESGNATLVIVAVSEVFSSISRSFLNYQNNK